MVRATFTGSLVVASLIMMPLVVMVLLGVAWIIGETMLVALILIAMSVFFLTQGLFAIT